MSFDPCRVGLVLTYLIESSFLIEPLGLEVDFFVIDSDWISRDSVISLYYFNFGKIAEVFFYLLGGIGGTTAVLFIGF